MKNVTEEPSDTHKIILKEEILEKFTEKFMEKILDVTKQNVIDSLEKFQDTKKKKKKKTDSEDAQKQRNELREYFNKQQSETEETTKREIYVLKMTTQNIKKQLNKDMENLRKKESNRKSGEKNLYSQIKNTGEGYSCRLEQVEDSILELEHKIKIKGKNREILVKHNKSCERNMQELRDSIKRPNLKIMGIEKEEKEVQAKGVQNISIK
jgi:hypothetical protein